ncbi:MFS transporter [Roseicella sp. GB24]|uniref:MFS transporter n=2 Tax=Roseicella aerolata TaxID=2883479 RepID=A0A9X1IBL2_9PROT|nr:MFS transporter [Roseicella aerolata]MCB4820363.1 MFS transporter [Roseicella aerolata]
MPECRSTGGPCPPCGGARPGAQARPRAAPVHRRPSDRGRAPLTAPPHRQAALVIGLAVAAVGLATTVPLPLYGAYAAAGGYGAGALALAFACYATTAIVTAPLLGPLPDRIGRRPCVLLGVACAALSTLLLSLLPGIPALAAARVAQGFAMGCVTGAAAAWAAELTGNGQEGQAAAGRRAAGVIATATIGSFATGGLLTLAALALAPAADPPVTFAAHLGFAALLLVLVARLPETLPRRGDLPRGGWLRRPAFPPGTWPTTLAILPGWSATGAVLTSVPAVLAAEGLPLAGPAAACAMMAVGVLAQLAVRRIPPRRAVALGLLLLTVGAAVTFWGAATRGLWPLLLGGPVVGVAVYALVYPGGLAAVAEAASGEERARAVAGFFVMAHLGFSAGPLAVGLAVDALDAPAAFALAWGVIALSAAALLPRLRGAAGAADPG